MSPSVQLQDALYDFLIGHAALTAFVGDRVYDNVPPDPAFPYISFGSSDFVAVKSQCLTERDDTFQIDVWTRHHDAKRPCREIVEVVVAALVDADLSLPSYGVVSLEVELARVIDDPAPNVAHGIIQITCLIDTD